jgi:hypothetical protein
MPMPNKADDAEDASDQGDDKAAEGESPDSGESEGKISPEEVDYSDNDLCETCANMGADGNCSKYGFPVDKTGHCEAGYESKDSGTSDMGAGDAGGGGGGIGGGSEIPGQS